ncbi:hypothetical protein KKH18_03215 [bacterium]|nr:hypothetical protein [bacterium]
MTLKKLFLFVLAIAILLPVAVNASSSRYMGIGGPGTDYIIYDASNHGLYPSLTHKYQKLLGIEYSGAGAAWDHTLVYCVWDFEGKSAVKFILDSSPSSMFDVTSDNLFAGMTQNGNFHMLSMVYGRPMGDDFDFGVALRYEGKSFAQDEIPSVQSKIDASYSSFGLSLGITALEKNLDATLGVDFAGFSRDEGSTTVLENDGSMRLTLQGRYWYKYSDTNTLVPHLRFVNHKYGAKYGSAGTTTTVAASETVTDLILGLGHNWKPVDACLIVFELGFESYGTECDDGTNTTTDSRSDIYWRAGGETRINGWLNGRLGAVRQWRGVTEEMMSGTNTYETTYGYSTTTIYCGGTFYYHRLYIDFLVEPDFLKYGPSFIGGDSGSGLASKVSMFYNFGKD